MIKKAYKMRSLLIASSLLVSLPACADQGEPPGNAEKAISLLETIAKGFSSIYKKASPATVHIKVTTMQEAGGSPFEGQSNQFFEDDFFRRFFPHMRPMPRQTPQKGGAAGFIISKDGLIVTNNHVVQNASRIVATLTDGREYQADVVGIDPKTDIAVLRIPAEGLPHLELGDSDEVEVGEWVVAIGSPLFLENTLTHGIVSATKRSQVMGDGSQVEDYIQTDAPLNPGNSGGPLLNMKGKVIGMNTAIRSPTGASIGLGFAVPSSIIKNITQQLIKTGSTTQGFIGVVLQPIDSELAAAFGLSKPEGVLITDVTEDSPAEAAGLDRGDIIVAYNGQAVTNFGSLRTAIALTPPGEEAVITVIHDGKRQDRKITIGTHPQSNGGAQAPILKKIGLEVREVTREVVEKYRLPSKKGVLITAVAVDSPAANADLIPGMVIEQVDRQPVNTPAQLADALLQASKSERPVYLLVRHGPNVLYRAMRVSEKESE